MALDLYVGTDRLDDGTQLRLPLPLSRVRESPAPWLLPEHKQRLAQQQVTDGALGGSSQETQAAVDARAGWKTIEICAALLPIGWG